MTMTKRPCRIRYLLDAVVFTTAACLLFGSDNAFGWTTQPFATTISTTRRRSALRRQTTTTSCLILSSNITYSYDTAATGGANNGATRRTTAPSNKSHKGSVDDEIFGRNFSTPIHEQSADQLLIHWKGEDVEGYSLQFRHWELECALQAVLRSEATTASSLADSISLRFTNALEYAGTADMADCKLQRFNQAMQYVQLTVIPKPKEEETTTPLDDSSVITPFTQKHLAVSLHVWNKAVQRCSTVHALYHVVAVASSTPQRMAWDVVDDNKDDDVKTGVSNALYHQLSQRALKGGLLHDWQEPHGQRAQDSWCVRVRHYGTKSDAKKERRHGKRARSVSAERRALQALKPLLLTLGGPVDLKHPDCKLYVMDGVVMPPTIVTASSAAAAAATMDNGDVAPPLPPLGKGALLARRCATGPRISVMAPATRLCITQTPLCPIAAYLLANIGQVQPGGQRILDPFCGSGATLLAAASILKQQGAVNCNKTPTTLVGIDVAYSPWETGFEHDDDRPGKDDQYKGPVISRVDLERDFVSRGLEPPAALLRANALHSDARTWARQKCCSAARATADTTHASRAPPPFDLILTDPPYGIRESAVRSNQPNAIDDDETELTPLQAFVHAMAQDCKNGTPLLRPDGGRMVCFCPCTDEQRLEDVLPRPQDLAAAQLTCRGMRPQPLNDRLTRWLVLYESVAEEDA